MPIVFVTPVIDMSVRLLCLRPYGYDGKRYSHRKGCPNFGKRDTCPPTAPKLYDYFDSSYSILAVWVAFNLELHRERLRKKHPKWSRRQLDCCLYWQGSVLANLGRQVHYNLGRNILFGTDRLLTATYVPEAMGVNVTATMAAVDVILEWPPEKIVRKVAFVGVKKG